MITSKHNNYQHLCDTCKGGLIVPGGGTMRLYEDMMTIGHFDFILGDSVKQYGDSVYMMILNRRISTNTRTLHRENKKLRITRFIDKDGNPIIVDGDYLVIKQINNESKRLSFFSKEKFAKYFS